jgi:hypothetical protein
MTPGRLTTSVPDSHTRQHPAERILTSTAALEGERKLRDLVGIKESNDAQTVGAGVEAGVRRMGDDLGEWAVPLARFLLSLDPGDAEVAAMRRPVVLAIEDLHWIDQHSEEVIRLLLDAIAAARVAVLLTYRPRRAPSMGSLVIEALNQPYRADTYALARRLDDAQRHAIGGSLLSRDLHTRGYEAMTLRLGAGGSYRRMTGQCSGREGYRPERGGTQCRHTFPCSDSRRKGWRTSRRARNGWTPPGTASVKRGPS